MSIVAPRIALAFVIFSLPSFALAQSSDWRSDPAFIEKVVSQIPVTDPTFGYKSLWERLPNLGMKVSAVRVELIKKGEAEPPIYLVGDQVIKLDTTKPNEAVKALCPIAGYPEFVKRGKKYLPQNLSAHWLMTNQCKFSG